MASIGDVFIRALADMAGFEADLVKKTGAAGDKAGASMGKSIGSAAQKAMTGAGAALGTFVAGSVQEFARFDDAMREVFSIMPGISAEAMGKMKSDVLDVSREFGILTDDLVPALGTAIGSGIPEQNVMEFLKVAAKAAKAGATDAETSVKALSATINAFHIPVENANEVADKFFNAIDKGVTTFPELAENMSQVSPVAAALGLDLDDVLAAVTAMTLQGTPTAQAITSITSSLTALQRTTPEMEDALKNLGFETGQAALDALGYQGTMEALRAEADRMGVPLIKLTGRLEGQSAILQLTGENAAKAQEILGTFPDSTGKVDEAFKTMEGGIGGTTRRMVAQLKAFAIEVGANLESIGPLFTLFGPAAGRAIGAGLGAAFGFVTPKIAGLVKGLVSTIAGSLGNLLSKALIGPIGGALEEGIEVGATKAARSGKVGRALDKLGDFMGSKLGKFLSVAFAAAAVAGVIETYSRIQQGLNEQAAAINADIANQLATGTEEQLRQSAAALQTGIDQLDKAGMLFGSEQAANLRAQLDAVNAELAKRAAGIPPTVAGEIAEGAPDVVGAVENIGEGVQDAVAEMAELAGDAAQTIPENIGEGILEKQSAVDAAMDRLTNQMENELTASQEIWKIKGLLLGDTLQQALKDKRPGVRAQAEQTRAVLQGRLDELIKGGGKVGGKMMDELRAGLRSKDPQIRASAQAIIDILDKKFESANGAKWGKDLGNEYALGLRASAAAVRAAGNYVAGAASAALRPSSPPKEGPLHTIDKWGGMYMEMIARGMRRARPRLKAAAAFAAGGIGLPSPVPPHSRLGTFVRDPARTDSVVAGSDVPCGGGGDTFNNNLHVAGALPMRTLRDVTSGLRRIQEHGRTSSRRREALYPLLPHEHRTSLVRRG